MNEDFRKHQSDLFKAWILTRKSPDFTITEAGAGTELDPYRIVFENDLCKGEVTFYEMEIIQLSVLNLMTDHHVFFLHFQMHTLEHAQNLFDEMYESMLELKERPTAKVLLSCTSGLTTGFFAAKLNESAQMLGLNYYFDAVAYTELYQAAEEYDMVLLAPQISYVYEKVVKVLGDKPVLKLSAKTFAAYDAQKLFEEIRPYLEKKPKHTEAEEVLHPTLSPLPLKQEIVLDAAILTIALIHEDYGRLHYASRVYDKDQHVIYDEDVLKHKLYLEDFFDICDTALARFPEIEMIGIAMPGIINNGRVSLENMGLHEVDIAAILEERYHRKVKLGNDVNSAAVGYYASQNQYSNISVWFQPNIGSAGGVGTIYKGQLIRGRSHVAGEVIYLPQFRDANLNGLWKTPEGALEMATQVLATVICMVGPDLMLVSSHLILSAENLTRELEQYIPRQYIPEIRMMTRLREYMLMGEVISCAAEMEKKRGSEN